MIQRLASRRDCSESQSLRICYVVPNGAIVAIVVSVVALVVVLRSASTSANQFQPPLQRTRAPKLSHCAPSPQLMLPFLRNERRTPHDVVTLLLFNRPSKQASKSATKLSGRCPHIHALLVALLYPIVPSHPLSASPAAGSRSSEAMFP